MVTQSSHPQLTLTSADRERRPGQEVGRINMSDSDNRVGDTEREYTLRELSEHFSAGQLSLAEFDERSAAAAAARTREELAVLLVDLPPQSAPRGESGDNGFQWHLAFATTVSLTAVTASLVSGNSLWLLLIGLVIVSALHHR